jgi:hypothetical protein
VLSGMTSGMTSRIKNVIPRAETFVSKLIAESYHIPIDPTLMTRGTIATAQLLSHIIQHLQTFESRFISSVGRK